MIIETKRQGDLCVLKLSDLSPIEIISLDTIGEGRFKSMKVMLDVSDRNSTNLILKIIESFQPKDADEEYVKLVTEMLSYPEREYYAPIELFRHQKQFIDYAFTEPKLLNGCEQGTGKTLATLAFARLKEFRRILIVCPKSLFGQWKTEIDRMRMPHYVRDVIKFKFVEENKHEHIHIVNYERLDTVFTRDYDFMIIDESSYIKSMKAQRTNKCLQKAERIPFVHLLNGTPIGNSAGDFYSQLKVIGALSEFDSYDMFTDRYCNLQVTYIGTSTRLIPKGVKNVVSLMRLINPYYFRVNKITCLDLPPKYEPEIIRLPTPTPIMTEIRRLRREGLSLTDMTIPAVRAMREQELCGGFAYPLNGSDGTDDKRFLKDNPKIQYLQEYMETHANVIVWCKFNAEVYGLHRHFQKDFKTAAITGKTTEKELNDIKARLNTGELDMLFVQIKKMYAGHNLVGSADNIYYSLPYSYIEYSQSQDRTHRIGQTKGVRYIVLLLRNTIDSYIYEVLSEKESVVENFTFDTILQRRIEEDE